MPKGSDMTWCSKLYEKHMKTSQHFSKPRLSQKSFVVHHFAEHVEYQADGFLEKNRDTVLEEQLKILKASEIDFIAELFLEESDVAKPQGYEVKRLNTLQTPSKTQATRKKTVGSQFRDSLQNLMAALNSTTPHYVRCIKPNDLKAPFQFDAKRAVEQLRACGVLETVRISAAGYPSRWTYAEFFQRYRMLINSKQTNRKQIKETCEKILVSLIKDQTKYQFGKTKIFFQAGQVAYLEKLRSEKLKPSCICIQKNIRMWIVKLKYEKIQKSALLIQCYLRGALARRELKLRRETRAAIIIQSKWRGYTTKIKYIKTLKNVVKLQALCRGYNARKNRENITKNIKAIVIQAHVRGWLQRIKYKRIIHGFIMLQAHFRRRQARKLFKQLKIEMRSVEHQRQLNKGLENKIISLQQTIEKLNKDKENLNTKVAEIEPLKVQLTNLKMNTNVLKENNIKLNELTNELSMLHETHGILKKEKETERREKEKLKISLKELQKISENEKADLAAKLEAANQQIKELKLKVEDMTNSLAEVQNERANHQKLIKENNKLEQRFEKARQELLKFKELQHQQAKSEINIQFDNSQLESLIEELDIHSIKESNADSDEASTNDGDSQQRAPKQARKIQQYNNNTGDGTLSVLQEQDENDFEIIKSQELEFENQKLREDLNRLRRLYDEADEGLISKEIVNQFNALNEEVQKRRDEVIQLKSVLVSKTRNFDLHNNDDNETTIEGNEFEMAYSSQKILIRMLENQLQESETNYEIEKQKLAKEFEHLKEENRRQHEILIANIPPDTIAEETFKYELFRLNNENADLIQRCDSLSEECKKYKKVLKVYIKRSKNMEKSAALYLNSTTVYDPQSDRTYTNGTQSITLTNNESMMIEPQIKFKHGEWMGIFEWRLNDVDEIVKRLVTNLKPRLAVTFVPGLPAYILFMCIRYADMINDDDRVRTLFNVFVQGVKKLIKKRTEDLDYIVLWMTNICRLLHNLKQYSGELQWQTHNTPRQNEHCLKNFDLTEYRGIVSDIAIWLFQGIIKDFEKKLNNLIGKLYL
jgi:myosin V